MYIITNTYNGGEYTPSATKTFAEAKEWMKECTVKNIVAWKSKDIEKYYEKKMAQITDDEVIEWAKIILKEFDFTENRSFIGYSNDNYNLMNIYYSKNLSY